MFEPAAVETIKPGDEIDLPVIGHHVVSEVDVDGDEIRVIYFRHVEGVNENRARDKSGYSELHKLVERSVKPHRAGDTMMVQRGNPLTAEALRAKMASGEDRRSAQATERAAWQREQDAA